MNRQTLRQELQDYQALTPEEADYRLRMLRLLEQEPDCFHRRLLHGHFTASAWIIDPAGKNILLLHHRKLDKWLQPGGHADGDENLERVAKKEACEETGLGSIRLLKPGIFDLDIHSIPARKEVPEHLHYDVRYFFTALTEEPLQQNKESKALAWVPLAEVLGRTGTHSSIARMLDKTRKMLTPGPGKTKP